LRQRLQHGGRVAEPRAVVEGQHHFLLLQEVELLEMLEAEAGAASGVDFDGAADTERVRIGAGGARRLGRGCPCRRGGGAPAGRAGAAAGAGWAAGACDHAALEASSEPVLATIRPAAIRMLFSLKFSLRPRLAPRPRPGQFLPLSDNTLVGSAAPTQR